MLAEAILSIVIGLTTCEEQKAVGHDKLRKQFVMSLSNKKCDPVRGRTLST